MILYRQYCKDFTSEGLRVTVNCCGLLDFKEVDYRTRRVDWQEDYQLLYIAEGYGYFLLDGCDCRLPAGTAVLYAPGETQDYGYTAKEGALVWFCHFKGEGIEAFFADCPIPTSKPLVLGSSREVDALFGAILPQGEGACDKTGAAVGLLALLQYVFGRITPKPSAPKGSIASALADICENYMCDRSIEEYAALCHLSKYHFLRLFKREVGVTPVIFRNEYRLAVAERLLENSNLTVEAAALAVGFSSAAYFCRLYKKSRGYTCRQK